MRASLLGRSVAVAVLALTCASGAVSALEEKKGEKEKLKACELRICTLVTKKKPETGDFACTLSKTWARRSIQEGSASGKMTWGFGDARCTVDLKIARAWLVDSVKAPMYTLEFPEHTVMCEVEQGKDVSIVEVRLAPKIKFENGHAKKAWIRVKDVKGPAAIATLVKTAAKIEDSIGLFQKPLLKAVNNFIAEKCPKVASGG